MILVLGGTRDARELAGFLSEKGFQGTLTVTSELAKAFADNKLTVRVGKLQQQDLTELLLNKGVKAVIDATHPFAEVISKLAFEETQKIGIPYLRYERPEVIYPSQVRHAKDFKEAASFIESGQKIFAAIGIRHLQEFMTYSSIKPENIYVRVLEASKDECLALNIPRENIYTGVGPYSYQDNARLFREIQPHWLITKASGATGGELEKINAALDAGINVAVIKRPFKKGNKYHSFEKILQELEMIR